MLLGVLAGALLGERAEVFEPVGNLFINAIKMLIVPLVFCSLIAAVTSMHDTAKLSRIGGKAIVIYLISTAIAVALGLAFGAYFAPGEGMQMVDTGNVVANARETPSLMNLITNLIPTNPVAALA